MNTVVVDEIRPEHFSHPVTVTLKLVPAVNPDSRIDVRAVDIANAIIKGLGRVLEVGSSSLLIEEISVRDGESRVQFS